MKVATTHEPRDAGDESRDARMNQGTKEESRTTKIANVDLRMNSRQCGISDEAEGFWTVEVVAGRTDGRTDEGTEGRTKERTEGWSYGRRDGQMDGQANGEMDGRTVSAA